MSPPAAMTPSDQFARACGAAGPVEVRATHRPTGTEQTFAFAPPTGFVGRAAVMTVRLDDPSVSQCHALLQVVNGRPYLVDLGSRAGVQWENGGHGGGWADPGRAVRVGAFDLRVEAPADAPADPDRFPPVAAEVLGPGAEADKFHLLDRPVTLVGRHPGCHLRVIDEAANYFHTALVNTADGLWAVDLLTRRGTLVNGRPTRLARLAEGDMVEYGRAAVIVRDGLPVARPLVLSGSANGHPHPADEAALQQRVAESVAIAFAPVREIMEHFGQCFQMMAGMVETMQAMQRDQTAATSEQMKLIQELAREIREGRVAPPAPAAHAVPAAKPPTQTMATPTDSAALKDAHQWFLDRLAKLGHGGQPPK